MTTEQVLLKHYYAMDERAMKEYLEIGARMALAFPKTSAPTLRLITNNPRRQDLRNP